MSDYKTVPTVASELKVTRPTIYSWIEKGRFPNVTHAHEAVNTLLVPSSDVESVRKQEARKYAARIEALGFNVSIERKKPTTS